MRVHSKSPGYLALLVLFLSPLPTWADETAVSDRLKAQMLTDEKIAELCRASIKHKFDLVEAVDENGAARKIPRCVANYEAMRSVADSYIKQEEAAKTEIGTLIATCEENPEQASCLDAGKRLAAKAADLHEGLSQNANGAIEQLAGNADPK